MLRCLALLLSILFATSISQAAEISLDRPGDREFVRDNANMLTEPDKAEIVALCDKLLTDKATPIIVITIDRMSNHGGNGMRIETFARLLFDQWEIGHAELNGQLWNTGILVLVSKGDRKARIELGAGWHRDKDQLCKSIMDDQIIPHFKRQDFSGGIKAGVVALDAMAREKPLPAGNSTTVSNNSTSGYRGNYSQGQPRASALSPIVVVMFIGIAIFTGVSLYRSGASGLAWAMWAGVFAILGTILYVMATSNRTRGGGGGFGGGSFGGGFSGGGGSSGSW